jgi:hypothetical protein
MPSLVRQRRRNAKKVGFRQEPVEVNEFHTIDLLDERIASDATHIEGCSEAAEFTADVSEAKDAQRPPC